MDAMTRLLRASEAVNRAILALGNIPVAPVHKTPSEKALADAQFWVKATMDQLHDVGYPKGA